MGIDYRTEFINSVKSQLTFLEAADASKVIEQIIVSLSDYNLERISTDLALYDDTNEKILKRYSACLYIDGKSEATIYQYQRTARKLAVLSGKNYTDMTSYDIRLFLANEKSRGVSNTTLENARANISAFFQWMTVEDVIPKNPCMAIKPIKCESKIKTAFTSVELDRLRSACSASKERALIEFLISSGVRVSELTSMTLSDIDVQTMTVHVKHGKGGKERTTYINDVAKNHLLTYITEREEKGTAVFYNSQHIPIAPGGIRHILNRLGAKADVSNVHPHRFRRTFATDLASRGMPIQEIQKLLGHSKLDTTMEYVSVDDMKVQASYKKYIV